MTSDIASYPQTSASPYTLVMTIWTLLIASTFIFTIVMGTALERSRASRRLKQFKTGRRIKGRK